MAVAVAVALVASTWSLSISFRLFLAADVCSPPSLLLLPGAARGGVGAARGGDNSACCCLLAAVDGLGVVVEER